MPGQQFFPKLDPAPTAASPPEVNPISSVLCRAELHFFIGKEHSVSCRMLVNFSQSLAFKSLRISRPIRGSSPKIFGKLDVGPKVDSTVAIAFDVLGPNPSLCLLRQPTP